MSWTPVLLIAPSLGASLIYVFGFTLWTLWISLSSSTLLPQYDLAGFKAYFELWSSQRWQIAYGNLLIFSAVYVAAAMAVVPNAAGAGPGNPPPPEVIPAAAPAPAPAPVKKTIVPKKK